MNLSANTIGRLDELVQRSQRLLALLPVGAGESRRVRWQPDARLVRYYTTLGLLDRPAELRGRTAYYHDRHLLQLLAIKTLQAQGLSLQAIQLSLVGQTDAALAALIGLPADWQEHLASHAADSSPSSVAPGEGRNLQMTTAAPSRFWERTPKPTLPSPEAMIDQPTSLHSPAALEPIQELLAITLAPGAQLLLDRNRYPKIDRQIETALHTLRTALEAAAHSLQDQADGGDNGNESGFPDRTG